MLRANYSDFGAAVFFAFGRATSRGAAFAAAFLAVEISPTAGPLGSDTMLLSHGTAPIKADPLLRNAKSRFRDEMRIASSFAFPL